MTYLEAVAHNVRVGGAPGQRAELGRGYESRQVEGVALVVSTVLHATEVEELGAVIDFRPEARLECLGCRAYRSGREVHGVGLTT